MRAAPPLAFTVRRFGVWRVVLAGLALLAVAVTALWWQATELPAVPAAVLAAAGLACALAPLAEARRARQPLALRWDGGRWRLGAADEGNDETTAGRLAVAIDLGGWLLLRFVAEAPSPVAARSAWIPLQRGGLEADWHAIRATLYSPPPAQPPGGARAHPSE